MKTKFLALFAVFSFLNMVDYFSTALGLQLNGIELNPMANFLIENGVFLNYKIVQCSVVFLVGHYLIAKGKEKLATIALIFFTALLAAVCMSNVMQLMMFVE